MFTIDPETAKDLDDALHIVDNEDGTFEVGVHIADVSHFVKVCPSAFANMTEDAHDVATNNSRTRLSIEKLENEQQPSILFSELSLCCLNYYQKSCVRSPLALTNYASLLSSECRKTGRLSRLGLANRLSSESSIIILLELKPDRPVNMIARLSS